MKLEKIFFKKELFALILRKKNQFKKYGVDFFTNNKDLLQVGLIKHKKNHQIKAHKHIKKIRKINYCTEVLIIKKGELKIRFYNNNGINIKQDKTLRKDDIIIQLRNLSHVFKPISVFLMDCYLIARLLKGSYEKKNSIIQN